MDDIIFKQTSKQLLNRFISKSRKFSDNFCVPDGLLRIFQEYYYFGAVTDDGQYNNALSYDYDYFAFVKSTKSLIGLRNEFSVNLNQK